MKIKTPIKAIRAKCLDCVCYQPSEVKLCPSTECPLYPYRLGHRPKNDDFTENTNADKHETDKNRTAEKSPDSKRIIKK